jgi:hypothetical protein
MKRDRLPKTRHPAILKRPFARFRRLFSIKTAVIALFPFS